MFHGMANVHGPVPERHLETARDVLARWLLEKSGYIDIGRSLPERFLYFWGDGLENYFTTAYGCGEVWNWEGVRMTQPRKDPRRQIQGSLAHARGKNFESRLDASFAYYADRGFAIVEKTPEPMRPAKSLGNGKFIAFFEKKAQPRLQRDY